MRIEKALSHFKTQALLANALGVSQPAVSAWRKRGSIPELQQLRLEALTGGKLKADSSILPKSSSKQ